MPSLDRNLRRDLENTVNRARRVAEAGARQAVEQLAVGHHEPWQTLTPDQRKLRNRLRAHGRQLGDKLDEIKGTQSVDRLTGECAYEHWHRLLFARFLAENDLLIEPDSGMALSLDECRELAREQNKDWLELASDFAQRMLPQIFRAGDPVLEVALPPEKRQELEGILDGLPREVFIADDSLGWVYQFWQAEQKDAVNASENKIGADELPAVTQLFTEDYMVLFLLHNTLGAWWAGKVLAQRPELALSATTEDEIRAACAVQGIEWSYLRFVREGDAWRPSAGTFPGWPTAAMDLTVFDPCMGSGHFLAFALAILVALRLEEEKLSPAEAFDSVLRENLFGLELDPRCTQIAAFNVGLTAWKLAGYRPLPPFNLACAGLAINAPLASWTALAEGNSLAENAMRQLYELFRQAPTLGSLIDPTRFEGELFVANFEKIAPLLTQALRGEIDEDRVELAGAARGVAAAAQLLAKKYTLVVTNVPYLGRGKQNEVLKNYCELRHPKGKADLATCFIERCASFCNPKGTIALVTPQSWWFQKSYQEERVSILRRSRIRFLATLGEEAWQSFGDRGPVACLLVTDPHAPVLTNRIAALDALPLKTIEEKRSHLQSGAISQLEQSKQLDNPDHKITIEELEPGPRLSHFADSFQGIKSGDDYRFLREFWEVDLGNPRWQPIQSTVSVSCIVGGLSSVIDWSDDGSQMARRQGLPAHNRPGIIGAQMRDLPVSMYWGTLFDGTVSAIVPRNSEDVAAIWAFCTSSEYAPAVRRIDKGLAASNASMVQVPFDRPRWVAEAKTQLGDWIHLPSTDDPTQWFFHGAVLGLHEAVARILGFRWPAEIRRLSLGTDAALKLNDIEGLNGHIDNDGIVCLPALRGEKTAAVRVQALLAETFGTEWSAQMLNELLARADFAGRSLDEWLRDGFFEQHCTVFNQRPFVWQIWDGRKDGFSALVNYHRLVSPNGEGRRILDKLTHTYLGDWLDRQRADQKAGVEGADGRVAAAEHLKRELERILTGEPPYDIFVRWKPLHEQPLGWEPDIVDGVRVNIRPFMTAKPLNARGKSTCILRVAPKIKWDKDRGKEPTREKSHFPWFWGWDESTQDFEGGKDFDGNRWNDLHYTRTVKLAARERAKEGKS